MNIRKYFEKNGFELYAVETEFLQDLVNTTKSYELALQKNKTDLFYKEINQKLNGKIPSNVMIFSTGPSGRGKSIATLFICEYEAEIMGSEFDVKRHVGFDRTEMLMKLNREIKRIFGHADLNKIKNPFARIAMMKDEETQEIGKGSIAAKKIEINIDQQVRKAQICFSYVSPTVTMHNYHMILRFIAINFDKELNYALLFNPETQHPIGYVLTRMPSRNIEIDYEREKNRHVMRIAKGQISDSRSLLKREITEDLLENRYKDLEACENKRQIMLIIEEVSAGRLTIDEQKDVYELLIRRDPNLDKRKR